MADDPTPGELLRRLDALTRTVESLATRLDSMASALEDRFVPRREYEQRIDALENDMREQAGFRRQVVAGFLIGLMLIVVQIVLTLAHLPGAS